MGKILGFLLSVAVLMSNANAALLVRYDFTNGTGGSGDDRRQNSVAEVSYLGIQASEFLSVGTSSTVGINITQTAPGDGTLANPDGVGVYSSRNASTSGTSVGNFSLSFNPEILSSINISRIVVRYRSSVLLGTTAPNNTLSWSLTGFDGVTAPTKSETFSGASGTTNSGAFRISTFNFSTPYVHSDVVNPLALNMTATRSGATGSVRMQTDYIEFYGDVVPEPTSMAIFGAMGLGLVARRFRKK